MSPSATTTPTNVAALLSATASQVPDQTAIAVARRVRNALRFEQCTFQELDRDSDLLADGLLAMGARRGDRLVLLVRPGIDFIALVFAMFKAGVVCVLVDPGMGRRNLVDCLADARPHGFVALPLVHAVRRLLPYRFPEARLNVTAGRRWFWGGPTLNQLRRRRLSPDFRPADTSPADEAAIIFTTGSTGPPKGVLYRHGHFVEQVYQLRERYRIEPGEVDVSTFPLFSLFNAGLAVTTVVPDMNPTRPAEVDPRNIVDAANHWHATAAFGSPALWNTVGRFCESTGARMPSVRRVLSAGAPVPPHVVRRMKATIAAQGEVHTPYGATEALPVASISGNEIVAETAARSAAGSGTCVGGRFPGIRWQVIRIVDHPLATIAEAQSLDAGEIGELVVQGPVVTDAYVTSSEANALHKIRDGSGFWHRMGDVGYLDASDRFWFCGRKSHRVQTETGTLFTVPCESIVNEHPRVYRSALVGVGPSGRQRPVLVVECWPEHRPAGAVDGRRLVDEVLELAARHDQTREIRDVLLRDHLPVDIRHNAKIFREKITPWAARQLAGKSN